MAGKKAPQNRAETGQFVKGSSGNPGGRPAIPEDVIEAARAHTTKAIATLAEVCDCDDPKARITAAEALLNRAWGKPAETHKLTGDPNNPVAVAQALSPAHLAALSPSALRELAALQLQGSPKP